MRCLIVATNSQLTSALRFSVSSVVDCEFVEAVTSERAIAVLLSDDPPSLLVLEDAPSFQLVTQYLQSVNSPVALVILQTAPAENGAVVPQGLRVLGTTQLSSGLTELARILDDAQIGGNRSSEEPTEENSFVAVPTGLLIRMGPLVADIYISLKSKRYLKIFQVGDLIDEQDVRHYYFKKGLAYFHCRVQDSQALLGSLEQGLSQQFLENGELKENAPAIIAEVVDLIYSFLEHGPMTEELGRMAEQAVGFALQTVKQNAGIKNLFGLLESDGSSYRAKHATMLAHVASCLAIQMKWVTDDTLERLSFAGLFHDIALPTDALARVDRPASHEFSDYNPEDQVQRSIVEKHPVEGAMWLRKAGPIARDVDTLIIQHHEKPDGSGFPGGLNHTQIAPLSALFIVAHAVVDLVIEEKVKMKAVPELLSSEYNQGNFKAVMRALEEFCSQE
jgi:hypothetical protein